MKTQKIAGILDVQFNPDLRVLHWMIDNGEYFTFEYLDNYKFTEIGGDDIAIDKFISFLLSIGYKLA